MCQKAVHFAHYFFTLTHASDRCASCELLLNDACVISLHTHIANFYAMTRASDEEELCTLVGVLFHIMDISKNLVNCKYCFFFDLEAQPDRKLSSILIV